MNNIFCFGDGYAHGHIWPEWPQILRALLPDYQTSTHTGIGSGNEYLITLLLDLGNKIDGQTVIFQWAQTGRFDKLIEDTDWLERAKNDPVYHFNFYDSPHGTWWLSSGSQDTKIQEYHNFFVQAEQDALRLANQKTLVENYLKQHNCKYLFVSTDAQELFCSTHAFKEFRGNEVQPAPLLHLCYVKEVLLPGMDITVSPERMDRLETLIKQHSWQAYDPDRAEIWQKISEL